MINRDASFKVKWKGCISDSFDIKQYARQWETLSADLCRLYVNQRLNSFVDSNLGGKLGSITWCAPNYAGVVENNNPFDVQVFKNMAYDYSQRELCFMAFKIYWLLAGIKYRSTVKKN